MIIRKRNESSEDPGLSGASRGTVTCEHPTVGMMLACLHDRKKKTGVARTHVAYRSWGGDEIRSCKIGNTLVDIILNLMKSHSRLFLIFGLNSDVENTS